MLLDAVRRLRIPTNAPWVFRAIDAVVASPTALAAAQMRLVRRVGVDRLPWSRGLMDALGVNPAVRRYYDPFVDMGSLSRPLSAPRSLPGVDLGEDLLEAMVERLEPWGREPLGPQERISDVPYYNPGNGTYGGHDGTLLHAFLRSFRPRRLLEVGSGNSTLVAVGALSRNALDGASPTEHVCIEPYEMPWLERLGVRVIRAPVERVGLDPFLALDADDVLFIDSSHVIRPQADVLFLYQEVLPALRPGVVVHVHDVFTPRDYPARWLGERRLFWNEQYLLEALIAENPRFEVLFPANHVWETRPEMFERLRPGGPGAESMRPTGFWLRRR